MVCFCTLFDRIFFFVRLFIKKYCYFYKKNRRRNGLFFSACFSAIIKRPCSAFLYLNSIYTIFIAPLYTLITISVAPV